MYSKDDIIALEPKYVNGIGNITYIYLLDGSLVKDNRRISTIFKQMARFDLLDMEQVRLIIKKHLYIKKNIPYVYNKENIFVPIKTRKPICKNDGASTYIKISAIKNIIGNKIYLVNGINFKSLESKTTIEKKINNGRLSALIIEEKNYIVCN
ncbi:MAG: hypothetical protein WAO56_05330 [Miniphocaeibacter sp.]|uniref:hypothetical protein n=1 Tax=Miniphocaeibacter sp. TaxID=3100973 RepID=UPI00180D8D0A|nr:hypothetical protein [Gallicola sp.]